MVGTCQNRLVCTFDTTFSIPMLHKVTEWLGAVLEELDFHNEAKNQCLWPP